MAKGMPTVWPMLQWGVFEYPEHRCGLPQSKSSRTPSRSAARNRTRAHRSTYAAMGIPLSIHTLAAPKGAKKLSTSAPAARAPPRAPPAGQGAIVGSGGVRSLARAIVAASNTQPPGGGSDSHSSSSTRAWAGRLAARTSPSATARRIPPGTPGPNEGLHPSTSAPCRSPLSRSAPVPSTSSYRSAHTENTSTRPSISQRRSNRSSGAI